MARLPTFASVFNFRDAGGYQTGSGKTVKTGTIFRSGALSGITDSDLSALSNLNTGLVFDLRHGSRAHQLISRARSTASERMEKSGSDGSRNGIF